MIKKRFGDDFATSINAREKENLVRIKDKKKRKKLKKV
jgi:hypothetical protein